MQELLLVNPRRRRRKGSKAKRRRSGKRRSAAQRRATAKLLAFNRARRGGSAPKRRRRRKSRARRTSLSTIIGATPMRRRRRRGARSRARRRNPISTRRLSLRSAISRPASFLKPALTGAVGAIAVNTVMARLLPMLLPAQLQATFMTGRVRYLTQGIAAIAVGVAAQKLGVSGRVAEKMAEGSLTVTLTDAIRDLSSQFGMPLGGMGYYLPGINVNRAVPSASGNPAVLNGLRGRMGAYVTGPGSFPGNVTPMRRMAGLGFGPGRF